MLILKEKIVPLQAILKRLDVTESVRMAKMG